MKRKKLIKAFFALSLALIMLGSFAVPTFAAVIPEETVSPCWTSISDMYVILAFNGTHGNASATARKQATASVIVGTLYLYQWDGSSWVYMDEVSGRKTVGTLGLSIDFVCETGVMYKAVLTVVAYTDNIGESETIDYIETCR